MVHLDLMAYTKFKNQLGVPFFLTHPVDKFHDGDNGSVDNDTDEELFSIV